MKILEEAYIGNLKLKNRILFAPMGSHIDNMGEDSYAYFLERAKGGAAMITIPVFNKEKVEYAPPSLTITDENRETYRRLINEIHEYGAKVCFQIVPGYGRISPSAVNYQIPVSASEVSCLYDPNTICHQLSIDEIKEIENGFEEVVGEVIDLGTDAIEIHAYGGYLTDQFLSQVFNKRTDEYGGDIFGRSKFLLELVHAVLYKGGEDFPLLVKYTPAHYLNYPGYRTIDEGIELSRILEDAGVKLLHVDAGSFENHYVAMPPIYQQEQVLQLRSAETVKKYVSIPVATNGKLGSLDRGGAALSEDKCDFLFVGRSLLADPYLPQKLMENRPEDIRPCIGCNECIAEVTAGEQLVCSVNPEAGKERVNELKLSTSKKVLIIGGGPGGMAAALDAYNAGQDVELWEKTSQLGGLIIAAGRPSFKLEVSELVTWYRVQIAKSEVRVVYNKEATENDIKSYGADSVIIATGSLPLCDLPIPGLGGDNVVTAVDAMLNHATLGEKLVVVGAGLVGCETSLHLTQQGKSITIIEMADKILPEQIFYMNETMLTSMLESNDKIKIMTSTKLLEANEDGVVVEGVNGREDIPCHTVVLAMGMSCQNPVKGLSDAVFIGDCKQPRHIIEAVSEAREAVLNI